MDLAEILEAARKAFKTDHLDDALVLLKAVETVPSARLWSLRADLHRERCEPRMAKAALDRALALGSGDGARVRRALLWNPIMGSSSEVEREWERNSAALTALLTQDLVIAEPGREIPWLDFYLAYRGRDDAELRRTLGRVLRQACPDLGFEAAHVSERPDSGRPIRIGFCSSNLRDHTIGRLNEAVVRGLGAHGFEVVLAVPERTEDPVFLSMAEAADQVVVLGRDRVEARRRLAAAKLDVLHYPDLGMDPAIYWLAHARLAAVQTVSWGHPITSGLPSIDAFLASESLVPTGTDSQFTERVVRLPDPMVCWSPPAPAPPMSRAELGLPTGRRVYLVPQTAFKLHPSFDRVMARILLDDPDGVLALLMPSRSGWRRALEKRFEGLISPNQLVWVPRQPRQGFLALLGAADVILDPFPFAGGHTSLEALAMGTPIVTLPTDQLRGRITQSWYRTMGLDDLVCADEAQYVRRAVRWARDPRDVRAKIASRRGRLFDQPGAVIAHARAWRELVVSASCVSSAA